MKEGIKLVAAGMNPMDLKRGVDIAVTAVVKDIANRSKKVQSSEEIAQIGTIGSNGDASIGEMIATAMKKVGNEGASRLRKQRPPRPSSWLMVRTVVTFCLAQKETTRSAVWLATILSLAS